MDKDWLYNKPEQWTANESIKKGKKFVANIKVVDDPAETTVKLHSDYAAISRKMKSSELVCCRSFKNMENKLATLKNRLWLLIYNSQTQHSQTNKIKLQ